MKIQNDKAGIDYGLGRSNFDPVTGIRFGVISQNSVLQSWCDSSEPFYSSLSPDEGEEPSGFTYEEDGYKCETCLDTDIMILKSPFYTLCKFCSPCYPGAGDLDSPIEGGIRTYCFGHDWFDNNIAPYPVFRVKDNTPVTVNDERDDATRHDGGLS